MITSKIRQIRAIRGNNPDRLSSYVSEFDETDYLLRSEKNRDRLLRSIAHVNSNVNLIEVEI